MSVLKRDERYRIHAENLTGYARYRVQEKRFIWGVIPYWYDLQSFMCGEQAKLYLESHIKYHGIYSSTGSLIRQ